MCIRDRLGTVAVVRGAIPGCIVALLAGRNHGYVHAGCCGSWASSVGPGRMFRGGLGAVPATHVSHRGGCGRDGRYRDNEDRKIHLQPFVLDPRHRLDIGCLFGFLRGDARSRMNAAIRTIR